jgi:hypothetical protein
MKNNNELLFLIKKLSLSEESAFWTEVALLKLKISNGTSCSEKYRINRVKIIGIDKKKTLLLYKCFFLL